jgi:DNA polymerase IV
VVSDQQAKSISHEQTFGADVAEADEVRRVLLDQVEQVAFRLRRAGLSAGGVSLKIRYGQFQTSTRSMTLGRPTHTTAELWRAARQLFQNWPFRPVRLIGMAAERLTSAGEPAWLFSDLDERRQSNLDAVADRINERFGKRAIRRGGNIQPHGGG